MADQLKARPVSGEIMTGPQGRPDAGGTVRLDAAMSGDILDADFVTLPRHPPTESQESLQSRPFGEQPSTDGMDMLRKAGSEPTRLFAQRGGPAFWGIGTGIAAAAFWISGGHALVSHMTFATHDSPSSALVISAFTSHVDASGERPVLFVDGEAGNDGKLAATLPPLEISVTSDDGSITRYRLGTSERSLAPGERFAFSSRVEVPRNGVKTVSVTFAG
jgi:hypothetical protein